MKNKHLTAIFTAGILFCSTCAAVIPVSPALSAAAVQEASALDFGYTVDHDGKGVTITEYKGKAIDLVIPEKIGGLPVKAIGSAVFKNYTALTTVSIPDSVTVIGEQAFAWCEKLYDVRFPANLEEIGDSAFSVCSNLTAVVLPNGLRRIGSSAFWRCENLLGIVIPSSVNEIGSFAFEVTGWLNVRRSENAAVAVNGILIDGRNCEGKVEIPDGVTAIADQAFYDCGEITEIVLPEGIKRIGNSAFEECTSLAAVNIPETLSSIGEHAFDHCIALTEITIPPTVSAIGVEAFHNCVRLTIRAYTGSYADAYFRENEPDLPFESLGTVSTQPAVTTSATETTESTVASTALSAETVSSSVSSAASTALSAETVSTSASSGASTALSAETSSTTESTKLYANADDFKYAVNDDGKSVRITKYTGSDAVVKIPPELGGMPVTAIGVYAFRDCQSVTDVEIPDGVKQIGVGAFDGCSSLKTVFVPSSTEEIGNGAFTTGGSVTIITAPGSYADTYAKQKSIRVIYPVTLPSQDPLDLNGDGALNIADAVILARFLAEDETLPAEQSRSAADAPCDRDGDGCLTVMDLCMVLVKLRDQ